MEGKILTPQEREFWQKTKPLGLILFARNIEEPAQVKALVQTVKDLGTPLVLIDQEGGRVQRLRPPHWTNFPPARLIAEKSSNPLRASWLLGRLLAYELAELGINVDCAPVLDVPIEGAHDVIGDRAFGLDPLQVGKLGRELALGLMAGGVLPVVKHIPGHGRALADSHLELPMVNASLSELQASDFLPFKALADMPLAMTAHVLYRDLDNLNPATTSTLVIERIIRQEIGFQGLLMSDDLAMQALAGNMEDRARKSLHAGCDILLHCNGKMEEMEIIARMTEGLIITSNQTATLLSCGQRLIEINYLEAKKEFESLLPNV